MVNNVGYHEHTNKLFLKKLKLMNQEEFKTAQCTKCTKKNFFLGDIEMNKQNVGQHSLKVTLLAFFLFFHTLVVS